MKRTTKRISIGVICAACAMLAASLFVLSGCGEATTEQDEGVKALKLQKVEDYLYTVDYTDYEEKYADDFADDYYKYFQNYFETKGYTTGGCAGVTNGAIRGRNYDWTYDDMAYFVIKTAAKGDRHATIGIGGSDVNLTKDFVESGKYSESYEMLPYATLDGLNDAGVCCQILVVPVGEGEYTSGTNPAGENLFAFMVTRYVLDYADSVDEAIKLLKDRNIYMPHNKNGMVQEFHWMISDPEKCVVVECVDNKLSILEDERVVTNFYLTNFDKTQQNLPKIAEGIERYNILKEHFDEGATTEGMMKLLQSVNYSKTYDLNTVPFWYSEYSGISEKYGALTSKNFGDPDLTDGDTSKAGAYKGAVDDALVEVQKDRAKAGEATAWITVFSSVYDMKNLTLDLCVQEGTEVHSYSLNG